MRSSTKASGVAAAVVAMAAAFIMPWEGKKNHAYLDVAGVPTICYGSTNGVKLGDYKTDAECLDLFKVEVGSFYREMDKCLTNKSTPISVQASLLELGYNIGSSGLCGSTAMRKANQGDYKGACSAVTMWVKARVNGSMQVVRGLVNRRNASEEMCMKDVS